MRGENYRPKDRTNGLEVGCMNIVEDTLKRHWRIVYDRGYEDGLEDGRGSTRPSRGAANWYHDGSEWKNRWICSNCGYKWVFPKEEGNYCPFCGKEMREVEDE